MKKSICFIFVFALTISFAHNSIAETWALLVGINDYQDSRISDLSYTVNDVTRFRDALIDKEACAVHKEKVYLMTNNSIGDELPTNTNVIFRLENLVSRIKPEDTFIFYFSGHGMMREGKQYLLTINSDSRSLTTLAASAIPQDTIHELLNKVKAHQVLVILDACRNDPEKGKGDKDNTLTDEIARGFFVKSRNAPDGMPGSSATLYASSVGERAYEWDSMKSGVFSHYLIEGLKGACIDANNEVTLRGLANYVINNVIGWSLDNLPTGKCQTPWLVSEGAADMTLAKITPQKPIIETPTKIDTGFRNDKPFKIPESANMALRSLVVPGMGQFYGKRNTSGTAFMVLGLGSLATFVVGDMQYNNAMDDYDKSITDYRGAITSDSATTARQGMIDAHNNADSKLKFQRIALIATGSVWVINAIHAFVIGPAESGVHNSDLSDANINAYTSKDNVCVALSYRF